MNRSLRDYIVGKNIVAIDDCEFWLKITKEWFIRREANVFTYDCPYAFLEDKQVAYNTDAVILDFYLGNNITAPQVLKILKQTNPDLLVITVSGAFVDDTNVTRTEEMKMALNAGSNRVAFKQLDTIEHILATHFKVRDLQLINQGQLITA